MKPRALIAIGGNALVRAHELGTVEEQRVNARRTCLGIVEVVRAGFDVVLTHGNGPQVGAALIRSEQAAGEISPQPLDVCVAATQGEIGYLLQQALPEALRPSGLQVTVATVIAQAIVSDDDTAMRHPTKPVGPFYSRADAEAHRTSDGWLMVEDASRGYRRVVPSPRPIAVVEEAAIRALVDAGVLVITLGGGGIPVVRDGQALRGVEAVVDKDYASALLASRLGATLYMNVTDVDRVYLDYPSHKREPICRVTASELARHHAAGHFPAGSMGPKVESVLQFLVENGRHAVITSSDQLGRALDPSVGTHIVPD